MKKLLALAAVLIYLAVLMIPAWIFFDLRGGWSFLDGLDSQSLMLAVFPLAGLYALTFVWAQIILGSNMGFWGTLFPRIKTFHRAEGVFALLFALTHPTLRLIGFGPSEILQHPSIGVASGKEVWLVVGYVQLFLMMLTVSTALLMQTKTVARYWRKIHYANYAVFGLAWLHSWFLGSDVQSSNLKYLWLFFAVTAIAAVTVKIIVRRRRAKRMAAFEA